MNTFVPRIFWWALAAGTCLLSLASLAAPPPGLAPVTKELKVWEFADIKLTVLNPTSIRIDWQARQGAAAYRIVRDGVGIADVTQLAPPLAFVDGGLSPGSAVTYTVQALESPPAPTIVAPATAKFGRENLAGARISAKDPVLETSRAASATTPTLEVPADLVATATALDSVRLTWAPQRWATGYRLYRDRQVIRQVPGNFTDDVATPAGTHIYAVQTLFERTDGTTFQGPVSREVSIRVGPLVMVAVGDSVMWGQGLASASKFTTKVRAWLIGRMGKDVRLVTLAHSGAITAPGTAAQEALATPGEVPNSFPTIPHQAITLAPAAAAVPGRDVDLVLVDGCINDVGVTTILSPASTSTLISNLVQTHCGRMDVLLGQIHTTFPRAKIVVTGYFPIASQDSDLTAISGLLMHVGAMTAASAAAFGIPLDPVSGAIAGAVTSKVLKDKLVANSYTFYDESNRQLGLAVDRFNAAAGNFAAFVPIPFRAQNAYAARDSWLWLVPTPVGERDEVFSARGAICNNNGILMTAGATQSSLASSRAKCIEASMGHPNVKGAQAYADAITNRLAAFLAEWGRTHAPVQRAP